MSRTPPIYLDHHATTPVDARVFEAMRPYFSQDFGNAASVSHVFGWRADAAVEQARERIAAALGAEAAEIVFTSGATESNNLAILGAARARRSERDHVVTVATEHPSVLDPVRQLRREGFRTTEVGVDADGLVDLAALRDAVDERTSLVSVSMANGEIGVLQPVDEIAQLCRERGALCHSDGAQAAGKIPIDLARAPVDLLSLSAHKIYGPKGIGALFVRRRPRARIEALVYGGGHERGLRSGTLPVALIVGLAEALGLSLEDVESEAKRLCELRERLWKALCAAGEVCLNGHPSQRLSGNLNVSFQGVESDKLLLAMPDLAISTGSACSSQSPEPSHVLMALGRSEALARASLRFGLGRGTTAEEVDRAAARVVEEVSAQRRRP